MFLRKLPSPYINDDELINNPPLISFTNTLPLTDNEPVNFEPICVSNTLLESVPSKIINSPAILLCNWQL